VKSMPELTLGGWQRFDAIRDALAQVRPRTILEVGAGEGGLGAWLAERYEYTGYEPDARSFDTAHTRLGRVGRGTIIRGGLKELDGRKFDLVCAFEVLEHLEDDARALGQWREHVVAGGHLLLSVPAHSKRFGPSDASVGHLRRYDREPFRRLLAASGFEIDWVRSWGFPLGVVLEAIRNQLAARDTSLPPTIEARTDRSGRWLQPKGRAVALANAAIARPFRWLQAPFESSHRGIGWIALTHPRVGPPIAGP
jgi:SAM-dependent methyltransferase